MTAPVGTEVGIHVDLAASVSPGDVIETQTGRRYGVVSVRVQARGEHAGRQHLRVYVLDAQHGTAPGGKVHTIRWYKRDARRKK